MPTFTKLYFFLKDFLVLKSLATNSYKLNDGKWKLQIRIRISTD